MRIFVEVVDLKISMRELLGLVMVQRDVGGGWKREERGWS